MPCGETTPPLVAAIEGTMFGHLLIEILVLKYKTYYFVLFLQDCILLSLPSEDKDQ